MNPINIYLYNGQGASPDSVTGLTKSLGQSCPTYHVIGVDGSYLGRKDTPPGVAYLFPGGNALEMEKSISLDIANKIKGYVSSQQSGFMGFCAGALCGAAGWSYSRQEVQVEEFCLKPEQHHLNLSLFSAKGPVFGVTHRKSPPHPVVITSDLLGKSFNCFWSNGPLFFDPMRQTDNRDSIAATYSVSADINPAYSNIEIKAAVIMETGKRIILSGVHPELARWAQEHNHPLSDEDVKMNDKLFISFCQHIGLETKVD